MTLIWVVVTTYIHFRIYLVDLSEDHCVTDFLLGWFHILCLIPHSNIRTLVNTVFIWQDWWTLSKISHTLTAYTQRAMLWINANVNDRPEKESEMNRSQCEAPVHLYGGGRVMILLCFCSRWAITMWRNAPEDLSVVSTIEDSLSSGSSSLLSSPGLSPSMCLQVWSFLTWHLEWVAVVSQGWEVEVRGHYVGGYGRNFRLILTAKMNERIKDFPPH